MPHCKIQFLERLLLFANNIRLAIICGVLVSCGKVQVTACNPSSNNC